MRISPCLPGDEENFSENAGAAKDAAHPAHAQGGRAAEGGQGHPHPHQQHQVPHQRQREQH